MHVGILGCDESGSCRLVSFPVISKTLITAAMGDAAADYYVAQHTAMVDCMAKKFYKCGAKYVSWLATQCAAASRSV